MKIWNKSSKWTQDLSYFQTQPSSSEEGGSDYDSPVQGENTQIFHSNIVLELL
jgi:hypothetical protein